MKNNNISVKRFKRTPGAVIVHPHLLLLPHTTMMTIQINSFINYNWPAGNWEPVVDHRNKRKCEFTPIVNQSQWSLKIKTTIFRRFPTIIIAPI